MSPKMFFRLKNKQYWFVQDMVKKTVCKRFDLHKIESEWLEIRFDGGLSEKAAHKSEVHACGWLM